jgi:hypothetical protein
MSERHSATIPAQFYSPYRTFITNFKHKPQNSARTSYKIKTKSSNSAVKFLFHFVICSWFWSLDFLFGPTHDTKSHEERSGLRGRHTISPPRPIHREVKWLSRHARMRNAKCDSALSYVTWRFQNCASEKQWAKRKCQAYWSTQVFTLQSPYTNVNCAL